MNAAKIQLSAEELHLVTNEHIILTKNRIIQKVYELFGVLASGFHINQEGIFTPEIASVLPKISKGENYGGLPYVMLDYPRYFSIENILAIRTMFWWGNHFSITIHARGKFKDIVARSFLTTDESLLQEPGWYIQTAGDEWQHHYTDSTHIAFNKLSETQKKELPLTLSFAKIAYYLPLNNWDNAAQILSARFHFITKIINQFPMR
jgi:hypothetical protein